MSENSLDNIADFFVIKHLIALTANNEYTVSFPKESFIDSQVSSFLNSDKKAMIFSCHSYFSDFIMLYCILKTQKLETVISRKSGDIIKMQKGR